MKRPGCQLCHATLEPRAAYFARVEPSSSVFLPANHFPAVNAGCKKNKQGNLSGPCTQLYDVAFADEKGATLRSAYGSIANADAEPAGPAVAGWGPRGVQSEDAAASSGSSSTAHAARGLRGSLMPTILAHPAARAMRWLTSPRSPRFRAAQGFTPDRPGLGQADPLAGAS